MEGSGVFSDKQFGFLRNRETKDALAYSTNYIYERIYRGRKVLAAFIDLRRAFDTVNHRILLRKLEKLGIRGIALSLLRSYLTNRRARVKLDGIISEEMSLSIGVPQGSLLGPLSFVIYIKDLLQLPCIAYADDTVVLVDGGTWKEVEGAANRVLQATRE